MPATHARFLRPHSQANTPIMALRRWPPLDTSMAPTPAGCTRHSARATSTTWTNGYDREHRDLASSWAVYSPAHPAGVALPDKERCPPKAEVVSSNLAGSANFFNKIAYAACLSIRAGEALGKQAARFRAPHHLGTSWRQPGLASRLRFKLPDERDARLRRRRRQPVSPPNLRWRRSRAAHSAPEKS
jgi:hypothetical protein